MIAWRMCNYFPHRVKAIASVCTPYQKPAEPGMPSVPDEILIRKFLCVFLLLFSSNASRGVGTDDW